MLVLVKRASVSVFQLLWYAYDIVYFYNFVLVLLEELRRVAQGVGIYTKCQMVLSASYSCRDQGNVVPTAFA